MTIQELYNWAIENGHEGYTLCKNNNSEIFEVEDVCCLEPSQFYPNTNPIVIVD